SAWPRSPQIARENRIADGVCVTAQHLRRKRCAREHLSWFQREGREQRRQRSVAGDIEKSAGQPEILQKLPEMLIPHVAIGRKAPEVVEQDGGRDDIEYEQQRRLAPVKTEQNADGADDLERAAEHQQQNGHRLRQRNQSVGGLRHRRLMIENLIERAERKDQHQAKPGNESEDFILLVHGSLPEFRDGVAIPRPGAVRGRWYRGSSALS